MQSAVSPTVPRDGVNFRKATGRLETRRTRGLVDQGKAKSIPYAPRERSRPIGAPAMILIRSCSGHDELEACVQLQIETWGYDDTDIIPRKAFLVGQKIGGQVLGAFDTDLPGAGPNGTPESMVGFAMSLPGVKTGKNSTDGN